MPSHSLISWSHGNAFVSGTGSFRVQLPGRLNRQRVANSFTTTLHFFFFFFERTRLTGRNHTEMGFAKSSHAPAYLSKYDNINFDLKKLAFIVEDFFKKVVITLLVFFNSPHTTT